MTIQNKLNELGLTLPEPSKPRRKLRFSKYQGQCRLYCHSVTKRWRQLDI